MQHIQTQVLTTTASTISFVSIPQSFTDVLILVSCRTNRSGAPSFIRPHVNNTTVNQSVRRLFGNGSSASSTSETNNWAFQSNSAAHTANTFTSVALYIPNYTSAVAKSFSSDAVFENNATGAFQGITAGLFNTTAAITSIQLIDPDASFIAGSLFSLYGITAGSDGTTVVS